MREWLSEKDSIDFGFNKDEFTDKWFFNQNSDAISNLGARFDSKLNIDLPIDDVFNYISRNSIVKKRFQELVNIFNKASEKEYNDNPLNSDFPDNLENYNSIVRLSREMVKSVYELELSGVSNEITYIKEILEKTKCN